MNSFTEIMKVGAQIIDLSKKAWGLYSSYISVDKNLEVLKRKSEELSNQEENVMIELQREEVHPRKKRKGEVDLWLRDVKNAKDNVQRREDDIKNLSWMPLSRYRSAMLVEREIDNIVELQKKGRFKDGMFIDLPDTGNTLCTSKLVGKSTPKKAHEAIWKCLMDEKIGKIGVYGMGGIGKTTIMKHIKNHLDEARLFDITIWVTVSKALNLKMLQQNIAQSIELEFSDKEDEEKRSMELHKALIQWKKFVLILDDMWEAFSLEKVGIPEPTRENGCKVVLTTRDVRVCRGMETKENIQIMLLSEDEAWELFMEKVDGNEVLSSELQDVAKHVLHECGRLPLAIITVGRALRQLNDVRVWKNALDELRASSHEIKGMETDVYKLLRFSYDHLRNDTIQACFLYCALFPEDCKIPREELIEYWMGEGLIEEKGNRATELNKGHALLNELIDVCLLESVRVPSSVMGDIGRVKMHDLLRDMAISITKSNPHFVVKAGNGLEDTLKEDEWVDDVERISLMGSNIKSLPGQPNCPKLSTLFLQENEQLHSVPSLFFHHMKGLRVLDLASTSIESLPESVVELENLRLLDLSYTKFESLPESVAKLENLRLLLVHDCPSLKKVPSLRKLKALRVLDLSHTNIEELPRGMEEMINIRRLDLSNTSGLRTFQVGILPNLSSLEDLAMSISKEWPSFPTGNVTAVSEELLSLTRLTKISIYFSDLSSFVSYVRSMKLPQPKNFFFEIGASSPVPWISRRNCCGVQINGSSPLIEDGSLLLPDKTQDLFFNKCNISRLSKLPCLSNLKGLKRCFIRHCDELEFISVANDDATISSTLETMELHGLPNLRALCSGVVSPPTLTNLKTLDVSSCDGLRNLISVKLLQHLRNLEFVTVAGCKMMEEIIAGEDQDESEIVIPKLKELILLHLSELKRICWLSLICSSLEKIVACMCPQLRKLPISPLDNPAFALNGVIKGSAEWWGALEWDDPNTKTLLQPIFKERCCPLPLPFETN